MIRPAAEILRDIDGFMPTDGSWLRLDDLLGELFQQPVDAEGIKAMLRVFERFPLDEAVGPAWSIVHGLESLPGYEPYLVDSLRRRPSELGVVMLNRMLNVGQLAAGDADIHALLREIAARSDIEPSIRECAGSFLR
ncbi:MAG TPA: hypothetical protein VFU13_23220 [Steroidobacteraceae bacterium]|nr:hypothetical protein [Steroidobacteraceae bacterium]